MPMTWLADDRDVGREVAGDAPDDRLVADQDDPVLGVRPGVIEGAGHDLGRAVVAAHRVDRDADPGGVAAAPAGARAAVTASARGVVGGGAA